MPAPSLTLHLYGVNAVIAIGGQTIPLVCKTDVIVSTSGTPSLPPSPNSLAFEYEARYEDAFRFDTPEQILNQIEELATGAAGGTELASKWRQLIPVLKSAPILSNVTDPLLNMEVRLTKLIFSIQRVMGPPVKYNGELRLRIVCTASPGSIRLFNSEVKQFGAELSIGVADVTDLGFTWPV
ncbi:MAG: hypothetical protein EHM40_17355 [Chloroflexi bacterium]|nr:MAG: hypothetical protein EHM40_17355 [Chloroflexota bacterium]